MGEEVFIDANIFLEIFLKDSKSEECKSFLKSLQEQGIQTATTDFILYTCIIQVQNNLKNLELIKNVIIFFRNFLNLAIIRPSFEDYYKTAEIMQSRKLDFDDSLVIACMKNYGIRKLASFDKHFDNVIGIERAKI